MCSVGSHANSSLILVFYGALNNVNNMQRRNLRVYIYPNK